MKCPKCRYVSHDYLDACRKCNTDLVAFKREFNLMVLKPGDLDLGLLVDVGREDVSDRDRFSVEDATSDTLPRKFYIGLDEMTAATEVDIQFDPDTPNTSTEPGELTKTFYVPEVLAKQTSDVNLPDREAGLDEMTAAIEIDMQFDSDHPEPLAENTTDYSDAEPAGTVPLAHPESSAEYAPHSPVKEIDMGVGNLDDGFDERTAATEVDMQLDPDTPNTSTEIGALTKMFYVGLDEMTVATGVDMQFDPDNPKPLAENTTDCSNAEPAGTVPSAHPESSAEYAPHSPVKEIDMSVGNLDDSFDEFEDIQLDTSEIDRDIDFARNLPSTAAIEPALDYDAAEKVEIEESTPGPALEVTDDVPSLSEERNADTETGRMSDPDGREDGEKI